MKHLTPEQAHAQGYRAITKDIWPDVAAEAHLVDDLESTLGCCDAVWIDMPYGSIQAARKRNELILPTDELEKIKLSTK